MRLASTWGAVVVVLSAPFPLAHAHFTMLLPTPVSAKLGQTINVVYQWGHPFEHQMFDAPAPEGVFVVSPNGKRANLIRDVSKVRLQDDDRKEYTAYQFGFQPEARGDYVVVLNAPPIWMEEDEMFFHDSARVVIHVQAQKTWDASSGQEFEMVPLTRPYGLQAGSVFQAQVLAVDPKGRSQGAAEKNKPGPLAGALVEIEPYNFHRPPIMPAEELITRIVKTDPNGVLTCSLTESGWWCIAAHGDGGQREHNGKQYPVRRRAINWVFVQARTGP